MRGRQWLLTRLLTAMAVLVTLTASQVPPARAASPLPAPPGYEAAVARVPVAHWLLVQSVTIDRTENGQSRRSDRSIHLTPYHEDGQLWHEVAHIILYSRPDLAKAWHTEMWPHGYPAEDPVSRYGRTNEREMFAEAYREYLEHGSLEQPRQNAFLRDRVMVP